MWNLDLSKQVQRKLTAELFQTDENYCFLLQQVSASMTVEVAGMTLVHRTLEHSFWFVPASYFLPLYPGL
jgi:hypothetical protein